MSQESIQTIPQLVKGDAKRLGHLFAVSKRIVCGSRARFGLGVESHASKAQKYEIELIPTFARKSCCDNPARSRIARKVIRVPPCCFPSVRSIKQNAPTEAEAFCDIKTCLICIFDSHILHIISIHALRIEPKVFQPDTRHSGATKASISHVVSAGVGDVVVCHFGLSFLFADMIFIAPNGVSKQADVKKHARPRMIVAHPPADPPNQHHE